MNKKIILALLGASLLCGKISFSSAEASRYVGNYAVINAERVFSESDLAKKMKETLQKEFIGRQNDLRSTAVTIKQAALDLDQAVGTMSPEDRSYRQDELRRRDNKLIEQQKAFTNDLNQRTYEERAKIAEIANSFIKKYADKANFAIILQEAAYVTPSLDITDPIIQLMNGVRTIDAIEVRDPKEITMALINSEKVFSDTDLARELISPILKKYGNTESDEKKKELLEARTKFAAKANLIIKKIAETNKIDIIVQAAAYSNSASDITQTVIDAINGSKNYSITGLAIPTAVAVVNSEKVFKTYSKKNRVKLAEAGNMALKTLAEKKSIDIIVQQAAYVSTPFDVTDAILEIIVPPKGDEASLPLEPMASEPKVIAPVKLFTNQPLDSIENFKIKCAELGFKKGTEDFGKCVLRLSK